MKKVVAVLLVGLAVGLLAGCGGGSKPLSKPEYIKQMTTIGKGLSASISTLGSASTPATAAVALAKVQVDLRNAAKQLDSITPPKDVKDQHDQLTTAVNEFADELSPVITKLKAGNLAALGSVTTLKGLTDIQSAANAITNKGYKISG
jgi:hypothetical protein